MDNIEELILELEKQKEELFNKPHRTIYDFNKIQKIDKQIKELKNGNKENQI